MGVSLIYGMRCHEERIHVTKKSETYLFKSHRFLDSDFTNALCSATGAGGGDIRGSAAPPPQLFGWHFLDPL